MTLVETFVNGFVTGLAVFLSNYFAQKGLVKSFEKAIKKLKNNNRKKS